MQPAPRLIAITDATRLGIEHTLERAALVCERARPGSIQVQLRDRALSFRQRWTLGSRLHEITRACGQTLSVNDRIDLTALLGAPALHLGERSVSARDARALLGPDVWISRAWHPAQHLLSDVQGIDALVVSPVLAPRKGAPALELEGLERARHAVDAACATSTRPLLFALGGVDASNAVACIEAGADGVAAIGSVFGESPIPLLDALGITG